MHKVESKRHHPQQIKQLPHDLVLGFNAEGMYICEAEGCLLSFSYRQIVQWTCCSSTEFILWIHTCGDSDVDQDGNKNKKISFELSFITNHQSESIAATILAHIHAIMAETAKQQEQGQGQEQEQEQEQEEAEPQPQPEPEQEQEQEQHEESEVDY